MSKRPSRRPYFSAERAKRAAATRERLLDAAAATFARHGYEGATLESIAAKARVATPTLYAVFGSKASLARGLIARLKDEARVAERFAALVAAKTGLEKLRLSAEITVAYSRDGWAVLEALRSLPARERALVRVWREAEASRRRGQSTIVDALAADGSLRSGLSKADALDVLFALSAHDTYRLYVKECGWSPERFEAWLYATTVQLLCTAATIKRRA
jgi:AcrR family transcriptional regulator